MFGLGYVPDYITRKLQEEAEEMKFRVYVSDSLYFIPRNKALGVKYSELLKTKKVSQQTGDQIAEGVIRRLARYKRKG